MLPGLDTSSSQLATLASTSCNQNEMRQTSFSLSQGRQLTQTFFLETRSECKRPTEHATMLKEMFDKQEGIFSKHTSMFFFVIK